MTRAEFADRIAELFATRGRELYGGEAVTQLEHALQTAHLAEKAAAPPAEIVAALLHDVGHLLHALGDDAADRGLDDRHEELGVRFLVLFLPPAVTEPPILQMRCRTTRPASTRVRGRRFNRACHPNYNANIPGRCSPVCRVASAVAPTGREPSYRSRGSSLILVAHYRRTW